jgi:hypothetical protein
MSVYFLDKVNNLRHRVEKESIHMYMRVHACEIEKEEKEKARSIVNILVSFIHLLMPVFIHM